MAAIDAMDPDLRQGMQELLQLCASNGLQARITSTVRTRKQQKYLWDRYSNGNSALPAAPPGHSAHEYGWAFDMVVSPGEYQQTVGGWWVTYWGGDYGGEKDPVHFELPGAGAAAWSLGEQGAAAPVASSKVESALDVVASLAPGSPWWLGFIPEKYTGKSYPAETGGAIGALVEELLGKR